MLVMRAEAKEKRLKLDSLVHYDSAIASLSIALGTDASKFDPDGPLPRDIPDTNASKTGRESVINLAAKEGLTVRQLAGRYGGYSGLAFVGTPETVADEMEHWLQEDAADGFTITFPFLPEGLQTVTEKLVPHKSTRPWHNCVESNAHMLIGGVHQDTLHPAKKFPTKRAPILAG